MKVLCAAPAGTSGRTSRRKEDSRWGGRPITTLSRATRYTTRMMPHDTILDREPSRDSARQ